MEESEKKEKLGFVKGQELDGNGITDRGLSSSESDRVS